MISYCHIVDGKGLDSSPDCKTKIPANELAQGCVRYVDKLLASTKINNSREQPRRFLAFSLGHEGRMLRIIHEQDAE